VPEFGCGKVVLALIAIFASYSKIGHSFSATSGPGDDVFDLKRDVLSLAVSALASPLLQKILLDLVPGESPLLIFNTRNLRVDHGLHIKADCFNRYRPQRSKPLKSLPPRHDIVNSRHK
jgi:hypothetical protein